eukprot:CAMPEP_0171091464 /NCGR_PEP_ID=MMETSP0766_2-20121228/33509_1 /TAXON_ID=439317 /ORGANISM="Gambierdiscus australes, Strain CAWD 149" /LENGTH=85 /DNA_ID=CAMNT_0011549571 /DNA_START=56 /DNA_END=309 /DNA_ORIENTATION=+
MAMRATCRPMRPKPLMAMGTARMVIDDARRPSDTARAATPLNRRAHAAPAANKVELASKFCNSGATGDVCTELKRGCAAGAMKAP